MHVNCGYLLTVFRGRHLPLCVSCYMAFSSPAMDTNQAVEMLTNPYNLTVESIMVRPTNRCHKHLPANVSTGTFLHIAHEEGLIRNTSIHAGIRAPVIRPKGDVRNDLRCGFEMVKARDIDRIGIQGVIDRLKERVGDTNVYVSVDIDVLDPAFAPGKTHTFFSLRQPMVLHGWMQNPVSRRTSSSLFAPPCANPPASHRHC